MEKGIQCKVTAKLMALELAIKDWVEFEKVNKVNYGHQSTSCCKTRRLEKEKEEAFWHNKTL
jgi:hypothetical protein